MALKYLLNSTSYAALSEDMKKEYIAGDKDGEYILDVTDLPKGEDVGPIKRALEVTRGEVKTLKADKSALQAKIDEFPDVEALKKQHEADVGKYKSFTETTLLDATADALATEISTAPKLLAPVIKARLKVDMTGDKPVTQFLDAKGQTSADFNADALKKELVANPDFKAIIVASKASGGGAPKIAPKTGTGGTPGAGDQQQTTDLSKMTGGDLAARIGERRAAAAASSQ